MKYLAYCMHCIFATHPEMLTGYSLLASCDRCHKVADLALVKLSE